MKYIKVLESGVREVVRTNGARLGELIWDNFDRKWRFHPDKTYNAGFDTVDLIELAQATRGR